MREPSVCAVMLTANRPEMGRRALECFRRQTGYENRSLLILDTGASRSDAHVYIGADGQHGNERLLWNPAATETIGGLRNIAAQHSIADILIHWDDDDYSHPNRIAEQVALLQSSGADVVGYNEMLFWRERLKCDCGCPHAPSTHYEKCACIGTGKAWLYSNPNPNYALGTSLCYWRKTWERKPFEATSHGEDLKFISGLNVVSVPALKPLNQMKGIQSVDDLIGPRMIARIHSGNTSSAYDPRKMEAEAQKRNGMWKRVPEWDSYCAKVMT